MFSSGAKRRIESLEYVFLLWEGFMQISMEFETPADTKRAIDEILKCYNAFRTRNGWFYIYQTKNQPEVFKIPSHLNTLPEVNEWMYRNHTPSLLKSWGTIAADETRLVINSSHAAGDGVHQAKLIEHLSNPNETWECAPLPMSPYAKHWDEIMKTTRIEHVASNEPKSCRLFPILPPEGKKGSYQIGLVRKNANQLKCWDASKGRLNGLSESTWVAMGLMASARIGGFGDTFGVSTCVDLRRTLTEEERQDRSVQDLFSNICVRLKPTRDMTVGELGDAMRKSFNKRLNRKDYLGTMKDVWRVIHRPWTAPSVKGLGLEMSSIGPIRIKKPVKDAYLSLMTPDAFSLGSLCFMSYSIVNEDRGKNEFIGHTQYSTRELAKTEGDLFTQGIEHCMTQFNPDKKVGDALDELQRFVPKK